MSDSQSLHSQIFGGMTHTSTIESFGTIRRHQTNARPSLMANAKRIYDEVKIKINYFSLKNKMNIYSILLDINDQKSENLFE